MSTRYSGDPLLSNNGNGITITFKGGQPALDPGIYNAVILSLFFKPWFMNSVIEDALEHIGSDFTTYLINNAISVTTLNTARNIALKSLSWLISENIASEVDVRLRNPNGSVIQVLVLIKPPGKTIIAILATKYGLNWKIQLDSTSRL